MPVVKLILKFAMALSIVSVFSVSAMAQGRGGGGGPGGGRMGMGGGPIGLMMMKEVRDELKLDEEQVKELDEMGKSMRDSFAGMRPQGGGAPDPAAMQEAMEKMRKSMAELESKLEDMLDPKQMDRLVGLVIQRENLRALSSKMVAERLEITDEQKTKMAELEKENGEKMREMFTGGFSPEMRDKIRVAREEADEKIKGLLTSTQKELMETLKGPEFKFPEPQRGRGGPGGGGGRGNRGGDGGN